MPREVGVYFEKVCIYLIYLIYHVRRWDVFSEHLTDCVSSFSPRVVRLALSVDRGLPCMYGLFHRDQDQKGSPDRTTVSRKLIHVRDM